MTMENSVLSITFSEYEDRFFDSSVVNYSFSDINIHSDIYFCGESDAPIYTLTGNIAWSELFRIISSILNDFVYIYTKKYADLVINVEGMDYKSLSADYRDYLEVYGEPSARIEEIRRISEVNRMNIAFNEVEFNRIFG